MLDHDLIPRGAGWTDIPSDLLRAELRRRQEEEIAKPACGSGNQGAYNTPLHVFALVLILVLSTIACGLPLISKKRATKATGPNKFIFLSQHFGTGVLIATAFVHLLPTAFISLTDPCLPYIWSDGYRPMAGLIAMTSAIIVVGIEMFLTTRGAGHSHSHNHGWDDEDAHGERANGIVQAIQQKRANKAKYSKKPKNIALHNLGESEALVQNASPLPESTPTSVPGAETNGKAYYEQDDDSSDLDLDELELEENTSGLLPRDHESQPQAPESTPEEQKRKLLQCLLLEAGILFHSVFIGMAISVSTGTPFIIFLIAIAFHQTFEGIALGTRIASVNFPSGSPRPYLMVLAYGTTTPIGQAIGLVVHNMYDPYSQTGLLMVGIMNAISSGLLLFAGLVQLLAEDFLSEKSYGVLKGKRRLHAYLAVIGGALLMALVGAWA